jgi:AAA+ ATPase superfamily predicted ATPase
MEEYFPLRIVTGTYFCNRQAERKQLLRNLEKKRHTILVSPRRYGKTSLSNQVFQELDSRWVFAHADFLIALDADDIEKTILVLVGASLPKLVPFHKNLFEKMRAFFSFSQAKLVISESGPAIEFGVSAKPQQTIVEALMGLDHFAEKQKKQVALLFDEFQQVGQIKDSEPIEAAIRHAAERSKNVCYIFSGSNRHLLSQMFDDTSRPLYHLCEKLPVERIEAKEYQAHLNRLAKLRWGKTLEPVVLEHILFCSKCHPYYINLLCSRIWDLESPIQTGEAVEAVWRQYVEEEKGRIADEITQLTLNQRKILVGIAREQVSQPTNKTFLATINLSLASAAQAVKILLEKDMIYRDALEVLKIVDPSVEYFIQHFC